MPTVTGNIRTWGFVAFPSSELLRIRFVPSSAAVRGTVLLPARDVVVTPASSGAFTTTLAQTTNTVPVTNYRVVAEWFESDLIGGWVQKGYSEIPGTLTVPAAGGDITDLMNLPLIGVGGTFYGYGPPPSALSDVTYWDISGLKPVVYGNKKGLI